MGTPLFSPLSSLQTDNWKLIEPFLEMLLSERGASLLTVDAYRRDLFKYQKFLSETSLGQATKEDLQAYLAFLHADGLKARSVARHLSTLRQFYGFWVLEGRMTTDPTRLRQTPKLPKSLPKILSVQEVLALLKTAKNDASPQGLRLSAFLEIFYATGLRVSELLSLKLNQVVCPTGKRSETPFLHITGKGGKERLVALTPSAHDAITAYLSIRSVFISGSESHAYLFPSRGKTPHLSRQRVLQLLKNLADRSGLDPEQVSPHVLRHAFATHLLQGGADLISLQRLLGHSDLRSTQIYTHVAQDHLSEAVFTYHPLAKRQEKD